MADSRRWANQATRSVNTCYLRTTSAVSKVDGYAQTFQMKLENGQSSIGSVMGFLCSILTTLSCLGFAYTKA